MTQSHGRIRVAFVAVLVAALGLILGALALDGGLSDTVRASSRGKVGYSGNPAQDGQTCARCHRSTGGQATMRFWGLWSVEPGSTHMYTVTVGGTDQEAAGFNVSASAGSLRVPLGNGDVRKIGEELTQMRPKSVDFGTVHFSFLWTAPEELGWYVLYGAGNSVDLDGTAGGDNVVTETLEIWVESPGATETPTATPTDGTPTRPPSPTATDDATVVPTTPPAPSPTATSSPAPPTPPVEEPRIYLPLCLASWPLD